MAFPPIRKHGSRPIYNIPENSLIYHCKTQVHDILEHNVRQFYRSFDTFESFPRLYIA